MASGKKVSKMKRGIRNARKNKTGAKKRLKAMAKVAKKPGIVIIK